VGNAVYFIQLTLTGIKQGIWPLQNLCHLSAKVLLGNYYYYNYKKKRFRWRNVKKTARTPYNAKTVTKRKCDAKCEQSVSQMRSYIGSSVFNWRLKDASKDNDPPNPASMSNRLHILLFKNISKFQCISHTFKRTREETDGGNQLTQVHVENSCQNRGSGQQTVVS